MTERVILLADDSITIQKVVDLTFQDPSIRTVAVGDGDTACKRIKDTHPSLVLADVHMPGRSGYEVCRFAKQLNPAIPVVLLVGAFEPLDESEYRACGADAVLEKPFEPEVLLDMVEALLGGRSPRTSLVLSSRRVLHDPELRADAAQPIPETRLRVFLCHASQDKPAVRTLYRRLSQAGYLPWLDEEDILPGQDWDLAIRRALRQAHAVLVCLSRASVSKTGYVQKELGEALDLLAEQPEGTIFLVPLLLEQCEVPERLKHLQVARLYEVTGYEKLQAALQERVREVGAKQ